MKFRRKDSKRGDNEGWVIKKKQRLSKGRRTNVSLERAEVGGRTSTCQACKWKEISMHQKDIWRGVSITWKSSAHVP